MGSVCVQRLLGGIAALVVAHASVPARAQTLPPEVVLPTTAPGALIRATGQALRVQRVATIDPVSELAISPDGLTLLAVVSENPPATEVVAIDTHSFQTLRHYTMHAGSISSPTWEPDGSSFLAVWSVVDRSWTVQGSTITSTVSRIVRFRTTGEVELVSSGRTTNDTSVVLGPDGRRMLVNASGALAVGSIRDDAMRVIALGAVGRPAWSPRGDRIAFRRGDLIYEQSLTVGAAPSVVDTGSDTVDCPAYSSDGSQLAFAIELPPSGQFVIGRQLAVRTGPGAPVQILTDGSGINGCPVWSSDGWIYVYGTGYDGQSAVMRVRPRSASSARAVR